VGQLVAGHSGHERTSPPAADSYIEARSPVIHPQLPVHGETYTMIGPA
jgi:hypothetical protein